MIDLTKEQEIEKVLIEDLEKNGWTVHKDTYERHKVDIAMFHKKRRRYFFIEVKRKYTSKNKKSQTYNGIATALGQIIYRMKQKHGYYGIGAPDIEMFIKEFKKIPLWIKSKLNLYIFLVDNKGKIRKITPSQKVI